MKVERVLSLFALIAVAIAMSGTAVAQLVLDDFSTGPYQKEMKSGTAVNVQTGGMIGGHRETVFFVCPPGPCGLSNPFAQSASIQIRPATKVAPSALVQSGGYKVGPRLDVQYGSAGPLNLALAPTYDRLRVTFDASDLVVNFNILAFTNTLYSQTGCNLLPSITPVTIDFPFVYFTPGKGTSGADFTNITVLDFIFQSGSAIGANDWAVTSFQAIPTGAPPADVTCYGLGM